MAKNFAALAFTDAVKAMQEKAGSRASYARMERDSYVDGLTENEMDFIEQRDSFYMSSIGENGFPYIQHRGGPKGFIKVLDANQIGFIDFRGNMQYISVGNIATNNNVALIMVDYPARARLKILAKAEIVELKDDPALYDLLDLSDYKFKPERMMVLHVEAYDWNCPQHITPRYTVEEIEAAFAGQRNQITTLQAEVKALKNKLKEQGT
jgi:predicted pyridoxine 5'-phosphate oxidase superfamily flavin-nucleotide-binding protein